MDYPKNPPLECDIVMEEERVASGVIYPRAVSGNLRDLPATVGGRRVGRAPSPPTAAAAAEFGRAAGGFEQLETLPNDITAALVGGKMRPSSGSLQPTEGDITRCTGHSPPAWGNPSKP